MKNIAKTKFAGFCVILTEERYSETGITNVSFSQWEKQMIKKKRAYTSDVEKECYDGLHSISRKIIFPHLTVDEMYELINDTCITYESETMGALTLEYCFLSAKSYQYYDYYTKQRTNAYISILWEFDGFDNVEKESHCMQKNYKFQKDHEELIHQFIEDEDWDGLRDATETMEFVYDKSQLELNF